MDVTFVEERPMAGTQRPVSAGMTVGRSGADVALNDPEVSRRHAIFRQVDSGIGVEDLGSRNGTFVNDQQIRGITTLSDGDRVRFGNTVWRLGAAQPAAGGGGGAAAAAPQPEDPDRMPTGLRQAIPQQAAYGEMPTFDAVRVPSPVLGFSAARRIEATVYCYVVILVSAIGVTLFFIDR
jgi:pSer/pThr/pTyr-binding forkhead associated (FHA) protein